VAELEDCYSEAGQYLMVVAEENREENREEYGENWS
jgi:hypothetical protein